MSIGLKRTTVILEEHEVEWESMAMETISLLKSILGDIAIDIQHVGSTSIQDIVAKPIIDIAVGVREINQVLSKNDQLEESGVIYRKQDVAGQLLYVMGDFQKEIRTHHIHIVTYGSTAWNNYINFRDYLNYDKDMAREYSELKKTLSKEYKNNRDRYTEGKHNLINKILGMASEWKNAKLLEEI
ncbi:MAG: GrpB family protein [Eubacteriales bacterium]|nr:GrpB family protein [Eubacteriales bacterium]